MKEGEAKEEEDGRIKPESKCCCINVVNASLYWHGHEYDCVEIPLSSKH